MEGRTGLPSPSYRGTRTLEETLARRRLDLAFLDRPIELAAMGQILWAGAGIRDRTGGSSVVTNRGRTPLVLYAITTEAVSLYLPEEHALEAVFADDIREVLYRATLFQDSIKQAPLVIVITAEYARAEQQYGAARAERLALIEAGQVAQNILLQAYAMGLAAIAFGAFEDEQVSDVLRLSSARSPLQVIAIGYARSQT